MKAAAAVGSRADPHAGLPRRGGRQHRRRARDRGADPRARLAREALRAGARHRRHARSASTPSWSGCTGRSSSPSRTSRRSTSTSTTRSSPTSCRATAASCASTCSTTWTSTRRRVHIPDGTVPPDRVHEYARRYEEAIADAGGLDLQLLGIGRTGHIGFNEPGSARDSVTRLITLDRVTRRDAASRLLRAGAGAPARDHDGRRHDPRGAARHPARVRRAQGRDRRAGRRGRGHPARRRQLPPGAPQRRGRARRSGGRRPHALPEPVAPGHASPGTTR